MEWLVYLVQALFIFVLISMAVSDAVSGFAIVYPWIYGATVSIIFILERSLNYI